MQRNNNLITFLAYGMYFLTGAACFLVGSSLPQLVEMYGMGMDLVVLLGSSFALGRFATVYVTGRMTEKFGPKLIFTVGILLLSSYLFGLAAIPNFYFGMLFAFLGGVGMGAQDAVCPLMLSISCKGNYAGALSAGQAFFGIGSFATPFLVGVMLSAEKPFYWAYYLLLLVSVAMLACVPFVKLEQNVHAAEEEEQVKPLYAKKTWMAYAAILVACAAYCAVVNAIGLYTSSFAESIGVSASNAAFMLTIYNVGCVVGSFAFVIVLKKVKEQTVLIGNCVCGFAAILAAMLINHVAAYFILLFVAGVFLGVLFSVIIAIATRIGYKRISVASSYVATAGGASDILTPIVTGWIVGAMGAASSYYYVLFMIAVTAVAAVIVKGITSEKEIG